MVRLDGIQASNRGAFIMGQLPDAQQENWQFWSMYAWCVGFVQ